jgi:quercetin dioxygenase-like cupin family protein
MRVISDKTIRGESPGCCSSETTQKQLITNELGAENFAMSLFEIAPDGYSRLHSHPTEHEIFVLEGNGVVCDGTKELPIQAGDAVFIKANEQHQFKNQNSTLLKFICVTAYIKE